MMRSRFFHQDYNTSMSYKDTRSWVRDFIFSNTEAKHYKELVEDAQHYLTADVLKNYENKRAEIKPAGQGIVPVDEHPQELNLMSLMKAQWLNHEIQRLPYFDINGRSYVPDSQNKLKLKGDSQLKEALDPQTLLHMKWEKQKDKWYEWFLDNMH